VTRPRTPFGRQESVTSNGTVIERSVYDGFDHVVESQKRDDTGAMKRYQRIPTRTVLTAWAACPKGALAMLMRDR
jgi:hypothetical protein